MRELVSVKFKSIRGFRTTALGTLFHKLNNSFMAVDRNKLSLCLLVNNDFVNTSQNNTKLE